MDNARVLKELREIATDKTSGVSVVLNDEQNYRKMVGTIPGPASTPYEKGQFDISIELPEAYPFDPPKMKFITKVWHPNVSSSSGAICLDILKDAWSPALTLKTALLSIQALLASPEPTDPQDAVVAEQYLKNHAQFLETALFWTETYASTAGLAEKVRNLCEMGFPEAAVRNALQKCGGDENTALEMLLSGV